MANNTNSWHRNSPFKSDAFSAQDWRSSAERGLGDAGFEKTLVSSSDDGIEIQPLYPQHTDAPFYSRGIDQWEIGQSYSSGNIKQINQQILADLQEGVSTVELALSSQSIVGLDKVTDLERLLDNVHPQMIKLSLKPSTTLHGALLLAYYYRQKIATEDIQFALNIDPLRLQARTGISATAQLQQLEQAADHCSSHYSKVSSVCVDSSVYHNAGCTEAQELAFLISSTVEYLRAMAALDVNTAFNQIRFRLALDSDYFLSIAKLRAARELLNQVANACGATASKIAIDSITGTRAMTAQDESVNILRTSTQAAAAMAGGASSYICTPHDALTENSSRARRLARNTHHILKEESGLLYVDDPTRGSGYVEALTEGLCATAWDLFQQIESDGGMQQALQSGMVQLQIDSARQKREQAFATGRKSIIGVSDYPDNQKEAPSLCNENTDAADPSIQLPSITALVGELAEDKSIGSYKATPAEASQPLVLYRDSEVYEKLRSRSNTYLENNGRSPTVHLLTIGHAKDYSARVAFCRSFFAIAGIDTAVFNIEDNPEITTPLIALCSSDENYLASAQTTVDTLKNNYGSAEVWIAGNNPKVMALLEDQTSQSIHLRCKRPVLLDKALSLLGANQP